MTFGNRSTAQQPRASGGDGFTRRALVGGAAAAAAWASLPNGVHAQKRTRFGPTDRVNVAVIGGGGMGAGNMSALTGQNIVAVADVDYERVRKSLLDKNGALRPEREALKTAYDMAERFSDYRRMLDTRKDIEAVVIATPDHHHATAARMAMERGIHVYLQKPLTYTVREARMLLNLSQKNPNIVTQMGNQGHSSDDGRRVVELIRGGAIGKVSEVQVWTNRPVWPQGIARPFAQPAPSSLDWDLWRGPADIDWGYHPDYAHFNWRGWTPFGTGALGDMGAHLMDFPVWALEPGLPTRIETRHTLWGGDIDPWDAKRPEELTSYPLGSVTHFEFAKAKGGPLKLTWYDGGLMPPTPVGLPPDRIMEPVGGVLFIGDEGMLIHDTYGAKPMLIGEEARARGHGIPQTLARIAGGSSGHEMNWIRAIRGEEAVSSPFEAAAPLTETMLLGIVALRAEHPIEYDGATGRITNAEDANILLDRAYRKGWEL
ncbi:MAG: Gfo/Idh/MocA family oxidoreductase [Alphaproteobacteria bacterium]|nr:Gfo/Idh/MocA family oxidoreductase [Alphaproteobacteria bacterium]